MFYHWVMIKKLRPKTMKSIERFANTLDTTHFMLTNMTFNDESKHSECKGFYEGYIRALYEADIITQGVYEEIQDLVADYEEE